MLQRQNDNQEWGKWYAMRDTEQRDGTVAEVGPFPASGWGEGRRGLDPRRGRWKDRGWVGASLVASVPRAATSQACPVRRQGPF